MRILINQLARFPVGLSLSLLALRYAPGAAWRAFLTRLTGKRVRAFNMLLQATANLPFLYQIWLRKIEPRRIAAFTGSSALSSGIQILFCLVADEGTTPGALAVSLSSLPIDTASDDIVLIGSQMRKHKATPRQIGWTDVDDFLSAIRTRKSHKLLVPLRCGDQICSSAPAAFRTAWSSNPDAIIIYGDEDEIDAAGNRSHPWFKPDWNKEQFLAQDFISGSFAISIDDISSLAAFGKETPEDIAQALAYATVLANSTCKVVHLPLILGHRKTGNGTRYSEVVRRVVQTGMPPGSDIIADRPGTARVNWPLPSPLPRVTAIVPTRDQLPLLRTCLAGLTATDYPDLEVIVIDNDSIEPETIAFLQSIRSRRIQVLPYEGHFNFAAMNNCAVRKATGSLICFVNNDIEFLDTQWLRTMVRQASRTEAGAVGAKLLYPDGTIQHAGVAIGIGGAAGHMYRYEPDESSHGNLEPHVQREVSAVTAACMLVAREKFLEVGGFDEDKLAVAFNDVDLCLKLRAAGFVNYYVPHAVAIHHESKSRGSDLAPANIARYRAELAALQQRWGTADARDPNWNVNLDYSCEQMAIRL